MLDVQELKEDGVRSFVGEIEMQDKMLISETREKNHDEAAGGRIFNNINTNLSTKRWSTSSIPTYPQNFSFQRMHKHVLHAGSKRENVTSDYPNALSAIEVRAFSIQFIACDH